MAAGWVIEEQDDGTCDVRLDRRYVWWELDDEQEALQFIRGHAKGGKGTHVLWVHDDGYQEGLRA